MTPRPLLAALAALVALVTLVTGALAGCDDQNPATAPADPVESSVASSVAATADRPDPTLPDGWRWESFGDLQIGVPATWIPGRLSQWCVGATGKERRAPRVERPFGVSTLVGCLGDGGYGLVLGPVGDRRSEPAAPPDAAVRRVAFDTARATIIARTSALANRVAATATRVTDVDVHGCAPDTALPRIGSGGVTGDLGSQTISVCRYVRTGGRVLLDASEELTSADADALRAALAAAPSGRGPDADRSSCIRGPERQAVALVAAGRIGAWVHYDGCRGHGVEQSGGDLRRLTAGVLHWALSPGWSGGLTGAIPFPQLRALASTSP